ncbi:hypothetical protein LWI29_002677 [Acer saccharum]|uniref:Apple domain-containing protein n=1 Tax=Acer saccharum TaxID=4024 RepID=A0AA39VF48_ACESA|nr:hypothetical protein LWI29_002677 [Acer saccharum]
MRLKTYEVDYSNESDLFAYSFNNDSGETYITFPARNGTIPFMLTLDHLGTFQSLIWRDQDSNDNMMQYTCLPGFKPMYPQDWFIRCVKKRKVGGGVCGKGDGEGFLKLEGLKVPDARFSRVYGNVSLKECEKQCLKNCNVLAQTFIKSEEDA